MIRKHVWSGVIVFLLIGLIFIEMEISRDLKGILFRPSLGLAIALSFRRFQFWYFAVAAGLLLGNILVHTGWEGGLYGFGDLCVFSLLIFINRKMNFQNYDLRLNQAVTPLLLALVGASASTFVFSFIQRLILSSPLGVVDLARYNFAPHFTGIATVVFLVNMLINPRMQKLKHPLQFYIFSGLVASAVYINFLVPPSADLFIFVSVAFIIISLFVAPYFGTQGISILICAFGLVSVITVEAESLMTVWLYSACTITSLILSAALGENFLENGYAENQLVKETEKLRQLQTDFLAQMSHELRTPLTAIMGYTDILIDKISEIHDDKMKTLQVMKKSEEFLLEILNSVLSFSKISSNLTTINLCEVNLKDVFESSLSTLKSAAEDRNLELMLEVNPELDNYFKCEAVSIKQIITNLVQNALKFTKIGRITVRAELKKEGQKSTLLFSVTDTGIGIDNENIRKIFVPFYQVESSMSSKRQGGVGLGLAISKKLIERLKGKIDVESQVGRGTTFTVNIPVEAVISPSTDVKKETGVAIRDDDFSITNKSVLVVEDSIDNKTVIFYFLEKLGLKADWVENGKDAVDNITKKDKKYDLILMDMQMPIMNGYQTTRFLRNRGFKNPIIAITAHSNESDRAKCLQAGCSDYLSKPFLQNIFAEKVRRSLRMAYST